ncbi:MAG: S41 family peptidase [Anaerolineaceae bacterium]|nr:S41 family peptidase [Anaerolineaceae bacterium]
MNNKVKVILGLLFISSLVILAWWLLPSKASRLPSGEAVPDGVALVTGKFEYTNDFVVETYYVEHAVGLQDLTGFVLRDKEWELPVNSQVLGYMKLDAENNSATFHLALPMVPEGVFNDVDQDAKKEQGLQVFAVGYNPNLTGGVFSEGDDRSLGWPAYLASVKTDSENQDEVTGGKVVIWAADSKQEFPSGFGKDGLLFTKDDPVMVVPFGYSVVDLDQNPFKLIRDQIAVVMLYEPSDVAVKDFSKLSYTEAFDIMFEIVRKEYAFNGIAGKQLDWNAVYAELAPKVANAQEARDPYAYYLAMRDLMMKFNDGHVGLNGGEFDSRYVQNRILGGWGFAVKELDDKRVVVTFLLAGGPADEAGIKLGNEIIEVNGTPVQIALDNIEPLSSHSTDLSKRSDQTVLLTRGLIGQNVTIKFVNPGQPAKTVQMTSIYEMDSWVAVYLGGPLDQNVLPAEYKFFPESGVGYIKLNSNYDDLGLIIRVVNRALKTFQDAGAAGIVIDMRLNFGGSPLGLAGFLYDENIPLGQLEYYSDKTGKFEPEGPRDKVFPNVEQYRFDKMVLLVDKYCTSACEIEAYGFSQVPGMVVMGQYSTGGAEGEVARGQFLLPEGLELQIPTGRFTLPDGSIFLEGQGVQPTIRIPVDSTSELSGQDVVLQKAIDYITGN